MQAPMDTTMTVLCSQETAQCSQRDRPARATRYTSTDTAAPLSQVPALVSFTQHLLADIGLQGRICGTRGSDVQAYPIREGRSVLGQYGPLEPRVRPC